jgi:hypothetical protein
LLKNSDHSPLGSLVAERRLVATDPELQPSVVIHIQEDIEDAEPVEGLRNRQIILIRPRHVPVEDEPLARDGEGVGHGLLVADAVEAAVELGQVVELNVVLIVGRVDLEPWAEPCQRRSIGDRFGRVEEGRGQLGRWPDTRGCTAEGDFIGDCGGLGLAQPRREVIDLRGELLDRRLQLADMLRVGQHAQPFLQAP